MDDRKKEIKALCLIRLQKALQEGEESGTVEYALEDIINELDRETAN